MIQKDILGFDVPVNYISLVQIVYGFESLPKNFPLKLFAGSSWVIFHELLEGLTVAVLHLDVEDLDAFLGRCRAQSLPLTYDLLANLIDHKLILVALAAILRAQARHIALLVSQNKLSFLGLFIIRLFLIEQEALLSLLTTLS